ncbi:MAG: hypothetical protein F4057_12470 [Acidobacteria bacterium]|nr:hypothetical protein [Acidobacteriota bacterium]
MNELISFTGAGVPVDVSSMTALQGAQGLNNWTLARQHLVRFTDVQMMVHAWVIRREYPEREAFDAFCGEHVFTHTAEKAWLLAQTWEVARRSRDMQQLARVDPDEAVELMQDFVDAGLEQRVTDLDEDDRAIVQVLAAPRRQRRLRLREMCAAERGAGRLPQDVRLIEELTAERDAARAELAAVDKVRSHPVAALNAASDDLQQREAALAELVEAVAGALRGGGASAQATRERMLRTCDLMFGSLERLSAMCMGRLDEDPRA